MRRLALGALVLASALMAAAAEQRIALVVGNNAYQGAPLRNPVNDATAIAAKLRAAGFEVTLRKDVAQRELTRAISQFGQNMKPGAVALFYYAGHGMQVRGRNFLIPVDADIQSEAAARSEGVDVDLVLEQLGNARLSMVILDACRNNPFEGQFRNARGSGLAQIDAPKGTLVAYATAPGRVAADGEGANGVYTAELLKAMGVPGLKVEEVFKRVRVNVTKVTANQQIPWESSSLTGDFFFVADERPVASPNDALKAVADERSRRESESRLLKEEMEKLREEIRALRSPAPAQAPMQAHAKPEVRSDPKLAAVVTKAEPKQEPKTQAKQESKAEPKAQARPEAKAAPIVVAKIDTRPAVPADSAKPAVAATRDTLELLRSGRGRLTFAKAMAILLGVDNEAELGRLVEAERGLRRLPYHSAIAMGVNPAGRIAWGRSSRFNVGNLAEAHALEICGKRAATTCRVVVFDGDLREDAFLQFAAEFGKRDPKNARMAMLKRLPHE